MRHVEIVSVTTHSDIRSFKNLCIAAQGQHHEEQKQQLTSDTKTQGGLHMLVVCCVLWICVACVWCTVCIYVTVLCGRVLLCLHLKPTTNQPHTNNKPTINNRQPTTTTTTTKQQQRVRLPTSEWKGGTKGKHKRLKALEIVGHWIMPAEKVVQKSRRHKNKLIHHANALS